MTKVDQGPKKGKALDEHDQKIVEAEPNDDTIYSAAQWFKGQREKGYVKEIRAQQCLSALKSFDAALDPSEPRTCKWWLENLDPLIIRVWIEKTHGPAVSARTYKGKAISILREYQLFLADPAKYDVKRLLAYGGNGTTKPRKRHTKAQPDPPGEIVTLPFGGELRLPFTRDELTPDHVSQVACALAARVEDFTTKDAGVVGAHLATRAADFDPCKAPTAQMFEVPAT